MLLRWVAQHRQCPPYVRAALLPRLPWKALAAIAMDPLAHPHAVVFAVERLASVWSHLGTGARKELALLAPKPMWPLVWKSCDAGVLSKFLQHPRLGLESVVSLLRPPLTRAQANALQASRWREVSALAAQVLWVMDPTFGLENHDLVLGMAAHWIKVLDPAERLHVASRMTFAPLRRMVRVWAGGTTREAMQLDG